MGRHGRTGDLTTRMRGWSTATRWLAGVATGLLTATTVILVATPVVAATRSCGDVITQSMTLQHNMVCLQGPGLVIGADNVTLDLGGHHIEIGDGGGSGVVVDGFDRVGVQNGRVWTHFGVGVYLSDSDNSRVRRLHSFGEYAGLLVTGSVNVHIAQSEVFSDPFFQGLRLIDTHDSTIIGIRASALRLSSSHRNRIGNSRFTGDWSATVDSDHNTFHHNEFSGSEGGVEFGGRGNVIRNNRASGNYYHGIRVSSSSVDTLLVGNIASGNWGDGIQVNSSSTTVRNNVADDNRGWGIWAVPDVIDGGRNKASGNDSGQCLNVACD